MPKRVRDEAVILRRAKGSKAQRARLHQLLRASEPSDEARAQLRAMLLTRRLPDEVWNGLEMCPAGSLVETVVAAFETGTDIPLELPFFTTVMLVAADCLIAGSVIDLNGQEIAPALQLIGLAPSGAGKSYTATEIIEAIGTEIPRFPDTASAASFVQNLAASNRSLRLRDEFGKLMEAIETQTHMAELRDYLLRLCDGSRIERVTERERIVIEKPASCILGLSVDWTWRDCVPGDALLDGFAQRFGYFFAPPRKALRALYNLSAFSGRIREQWDRLRAVPLHPRYIVNNDARDLYEAGFQEFSRRVGASLPLSFVRRCLFSGVRLALVYHRLLRKPGPEIDEQDMRWSMIVGRHLLHDAGRMLELYDASDLRRKVQRVEDLLARARAAGRALTARDVAQGVHGVRTAVEARALLQLVLEGDPDAPERSATSSRVAGDPIADRREAGAGGSARSARARRVHPVGSSPP